MMQITITISASFVALLCFVLALLLPFTKINSGRWSWTNAGFVFLTLAMFWPFFWK